MKKLIIFAFARFFNWFKIKSPVLYTTVWAGLLWAQQQVSDPAVMQEILSSFQDAPGWVRTVIKWAPSILMGLLAPHTSEQVKEYRDRKRAKKQYGATL